MAAPATQALLVGGGYDGIRLLDTVESLLPGASTWVFLQPLPRAMAYATAVIRGASIIVLGGSEADDQYRNEVDLLFLLFENNVIVLR